MPRNDYGLVTVVERGGSQRGHAIIDYTNWRGERATREIVPISLKLGSNEWHPQEQWMVLAHDVAKGEDRWFAMSGIHSWQPKINS